jgi:hypothetical protein
MIISPVDSEQKDATLRKQSKALSNQKGRRGIGRSLFFANSLLGIPV